MLHIEAIWLAVGSSDLRGGMDSLLGQVVWPGLAQRNGTTPTCLPTAAPQG